MIPVAIYCRVSTNKEDQANSLESQQHYFSEYIDRKPEWELHDIYADEGITGTSTKKRAQFNRMINDAYAGAFEIILTKEVSRFSRNILDTIAYTRELKALGINLIFMNDGFSTFDLDYETRLSIMASIAQEESRKTSTRVTWGQQRRMEQGVVFGRSMLGYDLKDGKMTIDPEGAEIVRLIFHKYAVERIGTTELGKYLQKNGYRTFTGNPRWSNSHLIKILKNEKYVGDLIQRKTYTPDYLTHVKKNNNGQVEKIVLRNHHEPIIDRQLWELTQLELQKNNKRSTQPGSHSKKHLFSGLIRCGECGSSFVSRTKTNKDGTGYRRWACSKSIRNGSSTCNETERANCTVGKMIRDDDALNMVQISLHFLPIDTNSIISNVISIALDAIQAGESGATDTPERMQFEIQKIRKKKTKLLDSFLDGVISKQEMQLMKHRYDEQLEDLRKRETKALERKTTGNDREQLRQKLRNTTTAILSGKQENHAFYKGITDSICVFKDRHLEVRFKCAPQIFHFNG